MTGAGATRKSDPAVRTRGDLVVVMLALLLLATVYGLFWRAGGHGAEAVVLVDGQRWARLNLFQDQDLRVPGARGESLIRVRDGQVRFVASPCTTQQCVHQGWLSQGGEVAVCLPNRVSLRVLGEDPRFDAINF